MSNTSSFTNGPLNSEIRDKCNPDFLSFYDTIVRDSPAIHLYPKLSDFVLIEYLQWVAANYPFPKHPGPSVPNVDAVKDHAITISGVPCRIWIPEIRQKQTESPFMIYIHGGGMVVGNEKDESNFFTRVADIVGIPIITLNYSMGPQKTFPAGHEDAYNVFESLLSLEDEECKAIKEEYGLSSDRIVLGGTSSGANLAFSTIIRSKSKQPELSNHVKGIIVSVPLCDASYLTFEEACQKYSSWNTLQSGAPLFPWAKIDFYHSAYCPTEKQRKDPRISIVDTPIEGLRGLPNVFISVASVDPLSGEGKQFADKLKEAGNKVEVYEVEGMPHASIGVDAVSKVSRDANIWQIRNIAESLGLSVNKDRLDDYEKAPYWKEKMQKAGLTIASHP